MKPLNRRAFLSLAGGISGLAIAGCANADNKVAQASGKKVVVVGGGFAGATVAKYLRKFDASVQVTLIDENPQYITCPASNWVIGGFRELSTLTWDRGALHSRHGVTLVQDLVTTIDPDAKSVTTKKGDKFVYDRLIVAPGIAIKWNGLEGYDEAAAELLPHAWKAGAQTTLLRKQLEALPDGGKVFMVCPANPFRCPPGPYERASLIAHYLKTNKPKSKLVLFDAKDNFSKQGLFEKAWANLYGYGTAQSLIEWVPASKDGKIVQVDVKNKTLISEFGEKHKGDVINVIPPQQAGIIAQTAGLSNETGWCAVDAQTWESKKYPFIHLIGDASIAGAMPKSGSSANSQAKFCAAAVIALLNEVAPPKPTWLNVCYSLVNPEYAISVTSVYALDAEQKVAEIKASAGVSKPESNKQLEALYTENWYQNIVKDSFL
ncbi:NAD(P)/FAD-dependent oxidoreductase [Beggiatoa leptomitoformis]|uniref:Cytochrome C n=1 Tax=Beggiatoa leptomitoformis TaxID=288004 RepID=A0A2N9YBM4_9GAMM|nr:NAD(P)/FAD-dependent oxidoreductase [Beggiatoa leptomitoformis]ALG66791.1 cytochrome C [Beggiatoa leptomitoformis]AUI67863.1 cytochrome C [Beggiatoa leptomitoformis]